MQIKMSHRGTKGQENDSGSGGWVGKNGGFGRHAAAAVGIVSGRTGASLCRGGGIRWRFRVVSS
jgi:hypothetical protein